MSLTLRAALLTALCLALLSGFRLADPPLLPEEAWLAESAVGEAVIDAGSRLEMTPETSLRLPGLLAVVLAAALLAVPAAPAVGTAGACILLGMSPALVTLARTAGPGPFSALAFAIGISLCRSRRGAIRSVGVLAILAGVALPFAFTTCLTTAFAAPLVDGLGGAWGILAGPALVPWRLDLSLPAWLIGISLVWAGSDGGRVRKSLNVVLLLAAGAFLGLLAPRPWAGATAGATVAPFVLLAIARGANQLESRTWRRCLAFAGITLGLVGIANLHLAIDVLDPARRVPWDESARMLDVLHDEHATLVAMPTLPPAISLYSSDPHRDAEHGYDPSLDAERVMVVSHGTTGGLARATNDIEQSLADRDYTLRGELSFGELEAGMHRLHEVLRRTPAATHYLRVRRWEREPTSDVGAAHD